MINKISQNNAGMLPVQPKERSGNSSRVQEQPALKATNVAQFLLSSQVKPISLTQPAEAEEKGVEKVVESLSDFAQSVQRELKFSTEKNSGKIIIKVIDTQTGETIREIPSEDVLNMQKHLRETSEQFFSNEDSGVSLLFHGKA